MPNSNIISTPYVKIDLNAVEKNIAVMQRIVSDSGQRLRPHIKTHRSIELAHMQMRAGACGICCAKLGEAEVMAAGGIQDILITGTLVGSSKMQRLSRLLNCANVIVCCDNEVSAKQLSEVGVAAGRRIPVLVELLTHIKRGGVSQDSLLEFVKLIEQLPGLVFTGLMAYTHPFPFGMTQHSFTGGETPCLSLM